MTSGHAGEWIAKQIFDLDLEKAANAAGIDGRFLSGPLAGRTVNVKWYLKREGMLDVTRSASLDYYLVLTGPAMRAQDPKTLRSWRITSAYLFDAQKLLAELEESGKGIGVASSITLRQWAAAEIYPNPTNSALVLNERQRDQLAAFAG